MKLIKAWSGKWHIFEAELKPAPAIPRRVATCDGTIQVFPNTARILGPATYTYDCPAGKPRFKGDRCHICDAGGRYVLSPKPQPERRRAATVCGEEVLVRDEREVETTADLPPGSQASDRWGRRKNICSKCPINRRLGLS